VEKECKSFIPIAVESGRDQLRAAEEELPGQDSNLDKENQNQLWKIIGFSMLLSIFAQGVTRKSIPGNLVFPAVSRR
jgi:hypothetical protein